MFVRSAVPGFVEAIRKHILRAVHSTCQKVRRSTLAEYLRLDATALDELVPLPPPLHPYTNAKHAQPDQKPPGEDLLFQKRCFFVGLW
jgi:hypothetical protein